MAGGHAGSIVTAWMPEGGLPCETHDEIAQGAPLIRTRSFSRPEGNEALIGAVAAGTLVLGATSSLIKLNSWWQHFVRARCGLLLVG
jgi:hypothetical protein